MENNVCYRQFGPRDKYNRGNFALIREGYLSGNKGCHIEVFVHQGSALYEHKESIACCSDEVEKILKDLPQLWEPGD